MLEMFGFEPTQTDQVGRAVLRLLEASLDKGAREAAADLTYFPTRMLDRGLTWSAEEPFGLMRLYPTFYARTRPYRAQPQKSEVARLIARLCVIHPTEAIRYVIRAHVRQGRPPPDLVDSAYRSASTALLLVLREIVRDDDAQGFEEGLRRWQDAVSLGHDEGGVIYADDGRIALGFHIARAAAHDRDPSPWTWIESLSDGWNVSSSISAAERMLAHGGGLVDLSDWVLEELPPSRAHIIDPSRDILRGLLMVLAALGPIRADIPIGERLYAHRDDLTAAYSWLRGLPQEEHRDAIDALEPWLSTSIANEAERQRSLVRNAPIEHERIAAMGDAIATRLVARFPRSFLEAAASSRRVQRAVWPRHFKLEANVRVPKHFLISGATASSLSIEDVVADVLSEQFDDAVVGAFNAIPVRYSQRTPTLRRIEAAIARSVKRGVPVTHVLIPLDWRLRGELAARGIATGALSSEVPIPALGTQLVEWPRLGDAFLLRMPMAMEFDQYVVGGREVAVDVGESAQLEPDDEPMLTLHAMTSIRLRLRRRWISRVALGDGIDVSDVS